ncbi:G-protein alpha subunit [Ganoderma leucocontextum]|nr:G-protein alpha subunit [Ganoderma leucocontextum]
MLFPGGRLIQGKDATSADGHVSQWPPYPPPGESDLERALRLEEEMEAKRVSDEIDHELELERQTTRKKQKGEKRLLLLGQSESGKSTLLKNFQMHFTPKALRAESNAWRAVIHLNLVRSVNFIIDLLTNTAGSHPTSNSTTYQPHGRPQAPVGDGASTTSSYTSNSHLNQHHHTSHTPQPSSEIRRYKLSLSPLRQVEKILARQLSMNETESIAGPSSPRLLGHPSEVVVRGGRGWKSLLKLKSPDGPQQPKSNADSALENARQILDACRGDVIALWTNESVQASLREEGVVLREQSGFFLDQAERVANMGYEPTLDDILRARLETVGIEEHRLIMETSAEAGQHWLFYDVGGARGQRASWVPFFQDVHAIIFMCSTAGFNEVLQEDRGVNRLLDSFNLWKTVCSSKLLTSVQFILLLNKTDILDARLKAGVNFASYVKSYKDANDLAHVTEYLRMKFIAMHHHHSPERRTLHVHSTCAINIDTTSAVLVRIRDTILLHYLKATEML